MSSKPLSEEEFRTIYSKVPRLCVDLVIRTDKGILLTLRKSASWNNQWHLPGGTVLYKETIEQAVARKAKEELGLAVEIIRLLGYVEFPSEEKERGFGWAVSLVVLCDFVKGKVKPNEDASEVGYFLELPDNTISEHKQFLLSHWPIIRQDKF